MKCWQFRQLERKKNKMTIWQETLMVAAPFLVAALAAGLGYEIGHLGDKEEQND